eukprot:tig00000823_g4561.t1
MAFIVFSAPAASSRLLSADQFSACASQPRPATSTRPPSRSTSLTPTASAGAGGESGGAPSGTLQIPLFPLYNSVLLPINTPVLPWHFFDPRYRAMINEVLDKTPPGQPKFFGVVNATEGAGEGEEEYAPVGVVCEISAFEKFPDGRILANTRVKEKFRFRVEGLSQRIPFRKAHVSWLPDEAPAGGEEALAEAEARLLATLREMARLSRALYGGGLGSQLPIHQQLYAAAGAMPPAARRTQLAYIVAEALEIGLPEQRALLEATDPPPASPSPTRPAPAAPPPAAS